MPAHCEKSGIFQFSFFTKYEQTTVTKYCVSTSSKSEFAKFNYKGHVHSVVLNSRKVVQVHVDKNVWSAQWLYKKS